jgi:hypothetical protein
MLPFIILKKSFIPEESAKYSGRSYMRHWDWMLGEIWTTRSTSKQEEHAEEEKYHSRRI